MAKAIKKNLGVNSTVYEFLRLDYEKAIDLLAIIQKHKVNYQKFFIALVGVVASISAAMINFATRENATAIGVLGISISISTTVGLLLIVSSLVGIFIVKNLVSIRVSEVFFNNSIRYIRHQCVEHFQLSIHYPNIQETQPLRRNSADYVSIATCSFINLLMLLSGFLLVFPNLNGISGGLIVGTIVLVYFIIYIYGIEHELSRPYLQFSEQGKNHN